MSDVRRKDRGSPRSRKGDLWPGINPIFVLFHPFARQNRVPRLGGGIQKVINRLLPLFPYFIPSYYLKTQKL